VTKLKRVVLGVTGSVAAYKSADLIRQLVEKGFRVSVVMTREAERFITPLTLSSLSGEKVFMGMFDKDGSAKAGRAHKTDPASLQNLRLGAS